MYLAIMLKLSNVIFQFYVRSLQIYNCNRLSCYSFKNIIWGILACKVSDFLGMIFDIVLTQCCPK